LQRRDAAVVELASTFEGRRWTVSGKAAAELLRYAESAWKRRDRQLAVAPRDYVSSPRKLALFDAMKNSDPGRIPGQKRVAQILEKAVPGCLIFGNCDSLLVSNGSPDTAIRSDQRSQKLNAAAKTSEFEALAALARQPSTQKLIAEDHARIVAERQARVDRIAALDAQAEVAWPKAQAAIKTASAKVREAERRLREANEALATANAADSTASYAYTRARQAEEAALIAGADGATIEAWQRELLDEIDRLRRPGAIIAGEERGRHPVTRRATIRRFSNAASVRARLLALRDAFEASDLLKLEPDQARLPAIIAALREALPKVDVDPAFIDAEA
jgi:hypothetical protein